MRKLKNNQDISKKIRSAQNIQNLTLPVLGALSWLGFSCLFVLYIKISQGGSIYKFPLALGHAAVGFRGMFDRRSANYRNSARIRAFVVKIRGGIQLIETKQIAFIQMQNETPYAFDATGRKFPLSETLKALEKSLDPKNFFRINRSEIVNLDFIENLKPDFQDRLELCLKNLNVRLVSSTNRTPELRKWLANQ